MPIARGVGYHPGMTEERDIVDQVLADWHEAWPEYAVAPRELLMRIARIDSLLERRTKAIVANHDLTFYGFKILTVLRRAAPAFRLTPTEISRSLYVMSGTLTHQLDQLEEAGLVTRQPDPNDRRGVLVQLSAEGCRRVEAAILANHAAQLQALAPLTAEERRLAADVLRKLLRPLSEQQL